MISDERLNRLASDDSDTLESEWWVTSPADVRKISKELLTARQTIADKDAYMVMVMAELLTTQLSVKDKDKVIEKLKNDGEQLAEMLVWCGGANDFSPEGKARTGFVKGVIPALDQHNALMKEMAVDNG
jgi:hypothetical protein